MTWQEISTVAALVVTVVAACFTVVFCVLTEINLRKIDKLRKGKK